MISAQQLHLPESGDCRYDLPSDDLSQKLDYSMPAVLARFAFLVGLDVASGEVRPGWPPCPLVAQT